MKKNNSHKAIACRFGLHENDAESAYSLTMTNNGKYTLKVTPITEPLEIESSSDEEDEEEESKDPPRKWKSNSRAAKRHRAKITKQGGFMTEHEHEIEKNQ